MALIMARHEATEMDLDIEVDSAGTLMIEGHPADPNAIAVCAEKNWDLNDHRSKGLTEVHLSWADHILVMAPNHTRFIQAHHPNHLARVIQLGHLIGKMEIPDPIGCWKNTFRKNRNMIHVGVQHFLRQLAN